LSEPSGATPAPHYTAEETRHRILAIVAASSGNLVEWFDFYVYAFTALYFSSWTVGSEFGKKELLK
jgi:MHS family dicarboxylic acid transporter PcaT-like MFS transporter